MIRLALIVILCQLTNVIQNEQIVNDENSPYNILSEVSGIVSNEVSSVVSNETFNDVLNSVANSSGENESVRNEAEFIKYQREFLRQDLIQLIFEHISHQNKSSKCSQSLNDFKFALNNGSNNAFKSKYD